MYHSYNRELASERKLECYTDFLFVDHTGGFIIHCKNDQNIFNTDLVSQTE